MAKETGDTLKKGEIERQLAYALRGASYWKKRFDREEFYNKRLRDCCDQLKVERDEARRLQYRKNDYSRGWFRPRPVWERQRLMVFAILWLTSIVVGVRIVINFL